MVGYARYVYLHINWNQSIVSLFPCVARSHGLSRMQIQVRICAENMSCVSNLLHLCQSSKQVICSAYIHNLFCFCTLWSLHGKPIMSREKWTIFIRLVYTYCLLLLTDSSLSFSDIRSHCTRFSMQTFINLCTRIVFKKTHFSCDK